MGLLLNMNQVIPSGDNQILDQAEKIDQLLDSAFNEDLEEVSNNIVKLNELIKPELNTEADDEQ